jgi:hypothetical protein
MNKRSKVKPIEVAGRLVTPVTGIPAAPRNWAPSCPSCSVRPCASCETLSDHRETVCRCGETLGDAIPCPNTKVSSTQDGIQYCKCLRCGHSWAKAIPRKEM